MVEEFEFKHRITESKNISGSTFDAKSLESKGNLISADNFRFKQKKKNSWIYFLHPRQVLQWCCLSKSDEEARRRLGQKISYISLYEYCFIVDKHEREVAELKQEILDLRKLLNQHSSDEKKENKS